MGPRWKIVAVVGVLVLLTILWLRTRGERSPASTPPAPPAPIDPALGGLDQAIDHAAEYLRRVNGADGRFEYRLFVDGRHGSKQKYNILRHAGSIYALADYRAQTRDERLRAETLETIGRAGAFLDGYVRPLDSHPESSAVWSDPKEEGGSRPAAKLGGAGLALIAMASQIREVGAREADGAAPTDKLEPLARFVALMQAPNGDFRAKYEEPRGFVPDVESLYYPGEAILGLTMLYELDHDRRWLEVGAKGVARLIEVRRSVKRLPNDHWLMIAIDRLLPVYADLPEPPAPSSAVLDHAIALGRTMMDEQARVRQRKPDPHSSVLDGAFGADGRTTPTATRLEGLLALERALRRARARTHPGDADDSQAAFHIELRQVIARGIAFLRRSQVKEGLASGGIPAAAEVSSSEDAGDESDEGARGEVRIDFVQHALSAFLHYRTMCTAPDRTEGDGCPAR